MANRMVTEAIDRFTVNKVNKTYFLQENELVQIVKDSGMILPVAHYTLRSGYCSDKFLSFTKVTQHPSSLNKISREMIAWVRSELRGKQIDAVLAPDTAASHLAFDIAREFNGEMKSRAIFAEISNDGEVLPSLIAGHKIFQGENILVVIDVITTGASLNTLFEIVDIARANILGVYVFASRSESGMTALKEEFAKKYGTTTPFHVMVEFNWEHWKPEGCDPCKEGITRIESRDISR